MRPRPTLCRGIMRLDRFDRHRECFRPYPTRDRGEISISKSGTDRPCEISVGSRPGQSGGPTDYILCISLSTPQYSRGKEGCRRLPRLESSGILGLKIFRDSNLKPYRTGRTAGTTRICCQKLATLP